MTETSEGDGVITNQERLREKLTAGTLAKHLADAYDAAHPNETNRNALKQVVEDELDKARKTLEQDKNQVG